MKVKGKYALTEIVDSTFAKGKYRKDGLATVDVSNDLAKFARVKAFRTIISRTFTTIFTLALAVYLVGVTTLGLVKINPLTLITYPAFAQGMEGGYIVNAETSVLVSKDTPAPPADISGILAKIVGGVSGYGQEALGKNLNVNTFIEVSIGSDGRITFTDEGKTVNTSGAYSGELTGTIKLEDQYLIECFGGQYCQQGEIIIVPKENVIGAEW
jgi:hypothetical protein